MPTFSSQLPGTRATGDAVAPAADVNALTAALVEIRAAGLTSNAEVQALITTATNALKGGAPAAYDTLIEIATELSRGATAEAALTSAIGAKYTKPSTGIPESDLASSVATKLNAVGSTDNVTQGQLTDSIAGVVGGSPTNLRNLSELAGAIGEDGNMSDTLNGLLALKYARPTGGIPAADLSAAVRDSLVSVAANTAQLAALQATVDQILNPPAAAPTAMTLSAIATDGQVVLTRTGGESTTSGGTATATVYALYRGTTATGTPIATKFPFTDTGLVNGTAVSYIATAKNNVGTVTSAVVTVTPTATALPTPTFSFRAADITGVADLGAVASVPAGSGAGPAWAQTDTALQPSYRAAFNGRPALFCGGVLRSVSGIAYTSRGFVIGRVWFDAAPNSTTDQGIAASDDGPITNAVRLWRLAGAKAGLLKGIAWNSGTARTDTASGLTGAGWRVVAVRWGGGTVETFIDGVSDGATAGTVGTTGTRTVLLGASYVASGAITESMKGYINELHGFYQALTTDEINALFASMGVVRS